jgi:hypothetical protein
MSYVIIDVNTELQYRKPGHYCAMTYETERGAKGACTKLNKLSAATRAMQIWVVMELEAYRNAYPVKQVKKVNLMSGKEYMEAEDTPLCCSPASETYWSM